MASSSKTSISATFAALGVRLRLLLIREKVETPQAQFDRAEGNSEKH